MLELWGSRRGIEGLMGRDVLRGLFSILAMEMWRGGEMCWGIEERYMESPD